MLPKLVEGDEVVVVVEPTTIIKSQVKKVGERRGRRSTSN